MKFIAALARRRHIDPALIAITAVSFAIALVHLLTNDRYGFHRDELQFLSDARHLDWGFVSYPPLTPFVQRIALSTFGVSLVGLRLFSVIAQSAAIIVTGMMARALGGGTWAQIAAAIGVAVSPLPLFEGTEFQYTTFDYLWWVLTAYLVIRLLGSDDARWCVPIGTVIGVGLMTKYSIVFFVAAIVVGFLLTDARRFFLSRWFWSGAGIALLIFLPNMVWQFQHDFVSLHFLQHIHVRDVGQGRAEGFWRDQFLSCANRYAAPLWIAGLVGYAMSRRFRPLAWTFVFIVMFFWLARGRGYYTAGAYPMLMAMGGVYLESQLARFRVAWRWALEAAYLVVLIAWGVHVAGVIVPFARAGPLRSYALDANGDLREEIGWDELVAKIATIRDSLPPSQRANVGIVVGNYGEQGAIEILGPRFNLPQPISGTNSAWFRGYPIPPPSPLIILGHSPDYVKRTFASCRLAGRNANSEGIHNEESDDHPYIFVCQSPRLPWPEFWQRHRSFG